MKTHNFLTKTFTIVLVLNFINIKCLDSSQHDKSINKWKNLSVDTGCSKDTFELFDGTVVTKDPIVIYKNLQKINHIYSYHLCVKDSFLPILYNFCEKNKNNNSIIITPDGLRRLFQDFNICDDNYEINDEIFTIISRCVYIQKINCVFCFFSDYSFRNPITGENINHDDSEFIVDSDDVDWNKWE